MVKKMVSKKRHNSRTSIRGKTSSKKSKVGRKAKNASVASTKPAAELLNIPAPVNTLVQQPEVKVQPAMPQAIEPTPIFRDDTPKVDVKVAETKKESALPKIFAMVVCAIILLFWILVVVASIHINFGPQIVEKNITYKTYVQINNSFENLTLNESGKFVYLNWTKVSNKNNLETGYFGTVMLQGYLREEVVQVNSGTKTTTDYIVDDLGSKIKLVLGYSQQVSDYKKLFAVNNNTRGTYNVSGAFYYLNTGYVIDVTKIAAQAKSMKAVERVQLQNVTIGRSGIKFDLTAGWQSISRTLFGERDVEG